MLAAPEVLRRVKVSSRGLARRCMPGKPLITRRTIFMRYHRITRHELECRYRLSVDRSLIVSSDGAWRFDVRLLVLFQYAEHVHPILITLDFSNIWNYCASFDLFVLDTTIHLFELGLSPLIPGLAINQ